jgi:hypothetical protein
MSKQKFYNYFLKKKNAFLSLTFKFKPWKSISFRPDMSSFRPADRMQPSPTSNVARNSSKITHVVQPWTSLSLYISVSNSFLQTAVSHWLKLSHYTPRRSLGGEDVYSSYSFMTSALDGGEWSASRPSHALPPGKGPPVPIVQEAGWTSEPVWTQRLEEKSFTSVGIPARSQTDWANRLTVSH